jgi:hypothetical protein
MVTASTPPKLLDFVAVLGTKLSTYQRGAAHGIPSGPIAGADRRRAGHLPSLHGPHSVAIKAPWLTVCIAGIRSGKGDRIAKPLALYEALYGGHAAPGETVCVPIVAQDYKASAIVMGYIRSDVGPGYASSQPPST